MIWRTVSLAASVAFVTGVFALSCSKYEEGKKLGSPAAGKVIAVQIQGVEGCAAFVKTVDLVEKTAKELDIPIDLELLIVKSMKQAEELRFFGSPTVLIDGSDVEPSVQDPGSYGIA
jgi:hypothetical protein